MPRLEDFFNGFVVTYTYDPMWRLHDVSKKKNQQTFLSLKGAP
jgi:hypothetical protein